MNPSYRIGYKLDFAKSRIVSSTTGATRSRNVVARHPTQLHLVGRFSPAGRARGALPIPRPPMTDYLKSLVYFNKKISGAAQDFRWNVIGF
jgi:hypothetical protein